jgi:hypothetical protein
MRRLLVAEFRIVETGSFIGVDEAKSEQFRTRSDLIHTAALAR